MMNILTHLKESNCPMDDATIDSVKRILDLSFFTQAYKTKYGENPVIILHEDQMLSFNESIQESLNKNKYFKDFWSMTLFKVQRKRIKSYRLAINRLLCMKNIQEKMLVGY